MKLIGKDYRSKFPSEEHFPLFCCVRNETLRLPYFLKYYRTLGFQEFVFVDNASTDGTTQFLLEQDDCTVFWTDQPYSESCCGIDWINQLLSQLEGQQWVLIVDADEILVFPKIESIPLRELTDCLEHEGANALPTFLLDMYGEGPISKIQYSQEGSFISTCPYFDRSGYTLAEAGYFKGLPVRGGARQRLFWDGIQHTANPPYLAKTPLVKWNREMRLEASTHIVQGARPGSTSGALLHFKMLSDFSESVALEASRKEHWDDAGQYAVYSSVVKACPDLNPMCSLSERYENSMQLVELGLMRYRKQLSHLGAK
ncbi:glycosyltransferase family 2 protein [Gilvimarinus algae]|uniref:Glycosyltransferase family 2 protein n=1 Tax=Gilvimarinus algae TaxID=3058037 RepID=A0ABT8TIT3_9GAMM|nr:glycosyltransferase family 2 protein [Gilvimarinus sp. SDUM040014]MDO3383258.1 glycosyltransferase family 2 protein [Gilvimarinus sp. SDUM040014]